MAKLVKKKRRRIRIEAVAVIMISLSLICWLLSSLFVNTINTSLTIKIQQMNNQVELLKNENQSLNIEIQSLQNKERVYVIAKDAGLDQNQDNVISVQVD